MDNLNDLADGLATVDHPEEAPSTSYPPCTSPRVAPTVRQRNFAVQSHDAALHFQILDLGRQYYVWVSAVGPKLGNLHLAIKTPADAAPAVASLIPYGSDAAGEGPAMAQRLALKLGQPVVCSCNLPPNTPLLQAVAERRLIQELQAMAAEQQQQQQQQQSRAEAVQPADDSAAGVAAANPSMPSIPPTGTQGQLTGEGAAR